MPSQVSALKRTDSNPVYKRKFCFVGTVFLFKDPSNQRFNVCPAKNKTCHKCGKLEHFQSVCGNFPRKAAFISSDKNELEEESRNAKPHSQSAADIDEPFSVFIKRKCSSVFESNHFAYSVARNNVDSLLDTGAFDNFIREKIAKIARLNPKRRSSKISMTSDNPFASVQGKVCSNIHVQDRNYSIFGVVAGLCVDVILGQDFLKEHEEVVIRGVIRSFVSH